MANPLEKNQAISKKVCVVTGSRAEFGLLRTLMEEISAAPGLKLQVIATGMHLAPQYGYTLREIEEAGFSVDACVDMLLSSNSAVAVTKSMGLGTVGFADAFQKLSPDLIVVLGDRFEILSAVQAAMIAKIPVAHIHGGETTEGAFDEGIRHAITKMSHWHFVAAETYRKRVVQMGESPDRVFNVGAPGLDALAKMNWLGRESLEERLNFKLGTPLFLVTYHPATLGTLSACEAMDELLEALSAFKEASIVFTLPNADPGSEVIRERIERFVANHPEKAAAFQSLGQQKYLSLMKIADVVIGNSSSGLTEAPALKRPTVNIGDRQRGRLKATSVIDSKEDRGEIARAIRQALSVEFKKSTENTISLYGIGKASQEIVKVISTHLPSVNKTFFDVVHEH